MGFIAPFNFLWLVGSVGLLVLIYMRQRARSTLEVSSLMLFETIPAPVVRRRMLRLDLVFWLEAIALTALSLALAGLFIRRPETAAPRMSHALIFNLGAAMGAREGQGTRLDAARRQARALIAHAPAGEKFSVIGYALKPILFQAETADRPALEAALGRLYPMATPARPSALRAALMRPREAGAAVDLFTDRPLRAPVNLVDSSRLKVHRVGRYVPNLAIVTLDPGVPGISKGHCTVRSFAERPIGGTLTIETDRGEVLRAALVAEPESEAVVPFGPLKSGGLVHARIDVRGDALAADNDRWAYIAPGDVRKRALVLSADPAVCDELARILTSIDPAFNVTAASPDKFSPPQRSDPAYDIALMHDVFVPDVRARTRLLIYPPPPGEDGITSGSSATSVELQYRDADGTEGQPIELDRVRRVALPPSIATLVRTGLASGSLPLVGYGDDARGQIGVIAFDVRNHLLTNPDELPALLVTVDLLRKLTEPANLKIVRTGDWVMVPARAGTARLVAPDGTASRLIADARGLIRFQPMLAGRYQVSAGSAATTIYANYFDENESNLGTEPTAVGATNEPLHIDDSYGVGQRAHAISTLDVLLAALAMMALAVETIVLLGDSLAWWSNRHV
jgi:hypothetical protein